MSTRRELRVVTHFSKEDPECAGDYWSVEVFDEAGKSIATFGDAYHDKGEHKIEGFLKGVAWLTGVSPAVTREDVADIDGAIW